jgi:transposase-like protein
VNENHEVQLRRRRSREEIERLAVEYEASGARVSDFCRNHDLKPSVLQRHLKGRRLGKVESREVKRLVPVALVGTKRHADTPRECALEVVLSSGRRIEVRREFDSATLGRVVKVLEGL